MLDIKTIYKRSRKRPGRSKYLLSVAVDVVSFDGNGRKITVPAKIVCVRNRNKKKDWLAIICTNIELSETEIIRIYGKRWDIEVFFKSCKSMLKLQPLRLPRESVSPRSNYPSKPRRAKDAPSPYIRYCISYYNSRLFEAQIAHFPTSYS